MALYISAPASRSQGLISGIIRERNTPRRIYSHVTYIRRKRGESHEKKI